MIARGKIKKLVLVSLIVVGTVVAAHSAVVAQATGNASGWDDVLGAKLQVTTGNGTWADWYQPHCQPAVATVEDYGWREERDVCYISSAHAQLAVYLQSPGSSPTYALKREGDDAFHRITNLWKSVSNLVLLPNDTILGASADGTDVMAMYSLGDFQDKAVAMPIPTGPDTHTDVYEVDMSSKYLFSDSSGVHPMVRSITVSKNGHFAVAQALGWGLVRIDLQTRTLKLITTDQNNGSNVALAISNDGDTVVVTGNGSTQHKVYAGLSDCGSPYLTSQLTNRQLCYHVGLSDIVTEQLTYGTMYNPEFLDDNQGFVVNVWNEDDTQSRRLVLTPDPDRYRLDYLALGDSYTSGEGDVGRDASGRKYYLAGTTDYPDDCHLSSRSYPFLLRLEWGIANNRMKSVACSGAQVLPDMYGNPLNYLGQERRLKGRSNIDTLKQQATEKFTPGWIPQLEFVKKYQPKLVTLTGGGNDVGFSDILRYCATPHFEDWIPIASDCQYVFEGSYLEKQLRNTIDTQYSYNKKLIANMQEVSPTSKIVMIGYPSFISHDNNGVCLGNSGALTLAEIRMINGMVDRMNSMLQRVAHDTGVNFVDTTNALMGGRICEGSKYMTGTFRTPIKQVDDKERFHPNAEGHKRIAAAIRSADIYERGDTVPSAGSYTPLVGGTIAVKKDLILGGATVKAFGLEVHIPQGLLKALSQFTVTIHSEPTELGQFATDADGSFSNTLPLDGVEVGRHVLTIDGVDLDGNPIQLFQFIEVKASETDADGDGVSDDQDPCQYITQWYDEQTGEDICKAESDDAPKLAKLSTVSYVAAQSGASNADPYNVATMNDMSDHMQKSVSRKLAASSMHILPAKSSEGVIAAIILLVLCVGSWIGYVCYKKYIHK